MKKNAALVMAAVVVAALAACGTWYFTNSRPSYSGAPEPIVLGGLVADSSILIYAAEEQRFFAENGINFTFKTYDTGLSTVSNLLNKKIDIASAAEYPMAARGFEKADVSIIASMAKSFNIYLAGLTGRGIRTAADLKGKRIGLPRGTILEFYLGRFLTLNSMSSGDVTLVDLAPDKAEEGIAAGRVDAALTWEPYVSRIREKHAEDVVIWPVQSGQAVYGVLICRNEWIREHPDMVRRFLQSLAQAEGYIVQYPDWAKALLKKRHGYDDASVDRIWKEHQIALSLDQSLVTALEDEARWMMKNGLAAQKKVPDFLDFIYADGLKAVRPDAVNIVR